MSWLMDAFLSFSEDFRNAELHGDTTPALRHLRTLKTLSSLRWAPHHSLVQVAERPPPPHLRHTPTQLHPRSSSDPKYRQLLERGPGSSHFNYCWNTKFRTIGECSRTIECLPPAPEYVRRASVPQATFGSSTNPDLQKFLYRISHDYPGRSSSLGNSIDPFQVLNSYPHSGATHNTASGYHMSPREGTISTLKDGFNQLPKYLPTGCAYAYKESLYIGECCLPADPRLLNATAQKNVKNLFSLNSKRGNLNSVSEDFRHWGAAAQQESDSSSTPEVILYAADDQDGSLDKSHVMSRPIYDERSDKEVLHSNPPSLSDSRPQVDFRGSWERFRDWPPPIPTHPPSLTDKPWWVSGPTTPRFTLPPQRTTEQPSAIWDPWGTTASPTAPTTTTNAWWPPPTTTPPTVSSPWGPPQTTPKPRPTSPWWLPSSLQPFEWWTPGFADVTSTTTSEMIQND
ncbi:hypothetical protein FHG87_017025 [Trinorchestia longiramus]|nr:hypothetical protein FHG87_017025 [Trinorchestia longiramus]